MADTERIENLRRRVQMDPASIAFAALAEEYRREGHLEEAIATCMTGLRRHSSYLSAHVTLGRALVALGRVDDGRAEFEYVLRIAPENLAAIRALAEIHASGESAAEHVAFPAEGGLESASAAVSSEPAELMRDRASLALAASIPHHTVSVAPALLGLEDFLDAISRARGTHSAPASLGAR
jgi:tetratricopeptide (TPR) repeat protein